jgi:hypothetical protein
MFMVGPSLRRQHYCRRLKNNGGRRVKKIFSKLSTPFLISLYVGGTFQGA